MDLQKHVLALDLAAKKVLQTTDPKLPVGPRFNQLDKSIELYSRVIRQLKQLKGKVAKLPEVALIARIAAEQLECDVSLVRPLAQDFFGVVLDTRTLDLLAWQVAGNRKVVQTKSVSLFNNRMDERGWMAGTVLDVVRCPSSGVNYAKVKLLDGPGAGFLVHARLPDTGLRKLSRVMGIAKRKPQQMRDKLRSLNSCVLFQAMLYLNGTIPAYSLEQFSGFKRIAKSTSPELASWLKTTPKQKLHNIALNDERKKPCVSNLPWVCHECILGYDVCSRSCRSSSVVSVCEEPVELTLKGKNICPRKTLDEA